MFNSNKLKLKMKRSMIFDFIMVVEVFIEKHVDIARETFFTVGICVSVY
jgi:hypothetical protein